MFRTIFNMFTIAIFLLAGVWCLTQDRRIQRRAIAAGEKLGFNPFRSYIEGRAYVPVTRVIGAMSILIGLVLAYVLIRY